MILCYKLFQLDIFNESIQDLLTLKSYELDILHTSLILQKIKWISYDLAVKNEQPVGTNKLRFSFEESVAFRYN